MICIYESLGTGESEVIRDFRFMSETYVGLEIIQCFLEMCLDCIHSIVIVFSQFDQHF